MAPPTAILFSKRRDNPGRLHVGYRRRDWTKVWYSPVPGAEPDDDGTIPIGLFGLSTGGPKRREPMEGEVAYEPHFDAKTLESTKIKERERMQMQMLYDAWRYLDAKDRTELDHLEEELEQPNHRRWQSWFEEAKKWKRSNMKARQRQRESRRKLLEAAGIDPDETNLNSDTSDDSAYESDGEARIRVRAETPMQPPARPAGSGKKRKAPASKPKQLPRKSNGKQPEKRAGAQRRDRDHQMNSPDTTMSGALPERRPDSGLFVNSRSSSFDILGLSDFGDHRDFTSGAGIRAQHPPHEELQNERERLNQRFANNRGRNDFQPYVESDDCEELIRAHNGGMSYDEAMRAGMRASQRPQTPPPSCQTGNIDPINTNAAGEAYERDGLNGTNAVSDENGPNEQAAT